MLVLPVGLRRRLALWASDGYPHEVCGLLLGRTCDGRVEVDDLRFARNLSVARARDRYELDPADFLGADADARARGLEIVGVWHTHPDHPARPSETDRAAAWPGWSYLIVAVSEPRVTDVRSWRLEGERFVEEEVHES